MIIKGKHILPIEINKLWPMLQDAEVLARISPGVSKIEPIGDNQFIVTSDINIGPVRGSFKGELKLLDLKELEELTLSLAQKSKIGNAEATITMYLQAKDSKTTQVVYSGTAKVSGRLAAMGQRILGGVVSNLSKQIFKELEIVISEKQSGSKDDSKHIPIENKTENKKSFFQSLIQKILSLWR